MKRPANTNTIKLHYAGVFLVTSANIIIGQLRDDDPSIDNPGAISAFGGALENGEKPLDAAWRELSLEETNVNIKKDAIHHFDQVISFREKTNEWQVMDYYYARIPVETLEELEVYEGQGWSEIHNTREPGLIRNLHPTVQKLITIIEP